MAIGPVEKCLSEIKTPNIIPGEREDIKSQVTVKGSFQRRKYGRPIERPFPLLGPLLVQ